METIQVTLYVHTRYQSKPIVSLTFSQRLPLAEALMLAAVKTHHLQGSDGHIVKLQMRSTGTQVHLQDKRLLSLSAVPETKTKDAEAEAKRIADVMSSRGWEVM